jgi:hypothetical protein
LPVPETRASRTSFGSADTCRIISQVIETSGILSLRFQQESF